VDQSNFIKDIAGDIHNFRDQDLYDNVKLLMRDEAMTNLYFLATEILGYKDLGIMHKPLCDVVASVNPLFNAIHEGKKSYDLKSIRFKFQRDAVPTDYQRFFEYDDTSMQRLFLMFRGSFKTTIITIAHTIQLMLIYPDIRILICSHKKEEGSQEILGAIKRHFISNPRLRELFPEYCPQATKAGSMEWGTSERVLLPNRSPGVAFPEATIEIAGATTDVTGRHYDIIKADDLVTKDSVTNDSMLQKTRQMFSLLKFLFNQPEWGLLDVVGTPYHFNDLYANLRRVKKMTRVIIPATHPGSNIPTFPERFSVDGLETIKNDPVMGSYEYHCQYLLNPVPPDDQTFRPEWFDRLGFYFPPGKAPENLKKYVFVDPANKRRKSSDYTAIVVLGIDADGMIYLLQAVRDKLSVEDRTNLAIEICKRHDLKKMYYETIGFQDTDRYIILQKCQEQKYYIAVEEVKSMNVSKEDRIRGLQPLYEKGRIRWVEKSMYYSKWERQNVDMIEILRDEMLMFPKSAHDDLLDAHSQLLRITTSKPTNPKQESAENEFEWWRKQVKDAKAVSKKTITGFKGAAKKRQEIPFKKSWR
jgi:predicted phage terminase large subunit-like protein